MSDDGSGDAASKESFSLRLTTRSADVTGCFVELHPDGSVVLVVDGERLFRFESLDALLGHYDIARGARQPSHKDARGEVAAAEAAATVAVAAIAARPRAEKALVDDRVAIAIERLRQARQRLRDV